MNWLGAAERTARRIPRISRVAPISGTRGIGPAIAGAHQLNAIRRKPQILSGIAHKKRHARFNGPLTCVVVAQRT